MGSWVGPWVPFSKLSRQKAIETCEILIEQRDRQIRRAEAAEARLTAVLAVPYCRDVGHTEALHIAAKCCDPYETPCADLRGEGDRG